MNVYLKIKRTVAFKMNVSGKVRALKSLFRKKEGLAENLQDKDELVDYGIRSNSTLNHHLQGDSTKLFVSIPTDDTTTGRRIIVLETTTSDTVKNIKCLLQAKEGIEVDSYALFYNGKQLEDDMTLASLGIPKEELTLYLVFTSRDSLSVSVELPSKEVLKLEVKYMQRVCDLKAMVLSNGPNLLLRGEDLSYEGKRLNDHDIVAACDIKPNSTLQVLPSKNFEIFVRNDEGGRTHSFYVNQRDTVLDLKKLILIKHGEPSGSYCLSWESKPLQEENTLASYNIQEDATVLFARE